MYKQETGNEGRLQKKAPRVCSSPAKQMRGVREEKNVPEIYI